jgi:tetratricopeptide (TPR) repeat protein
MSKESKEKNKAQDAKPTAPKTPAPKPAPVKVPPLFRKIDWLVLAFVFAVVWTVYLFTLAPELTLEDSGELCTASFYAGIPHPPGYPFWAIYSWLWTLLPWGNVAWRVEVGESFAAAMACGLVGFMVSRGSSMLIEGIEELKAITREWENAICVVTGIVAGLLLGFDGFMWKESVVINRISLFDVPWIMVVALCLFRWIYAPHQKRYLYIGMFFFGVCATIHQTMLVAAMGIEVCIAVALPRLGRDLFLGNGIIYGLGLLGMITNKVPALNALAPMFIVIFHVVGIGSLAACFWLTTKTKTIGTEWKTVLIMGLLWMAGAAFYFYEPLAGMTDPPMQWGYPRTVEGFFHALSRGQYEKSNPTDVFHDPLRFISQLGLLIGGLAKSYSWVLLFISLLPFLFLFKMKNRERAWIIGLAALYLCIGILLTVIMNTSPDRQNSELTEVFFTASHAVVAIMIGYGLALLAAYMATHYAQFRRWGLLGAGIAVVLALYCLLDATGKLYFGPAGEVSLFELPHWIGQAFTKDQYGSPVYANLILVAIPIILLVALVVYRQRGPVLIFLCLITAMPVWSGLSHWYTSEQRNHWFGYWFGHDMFTPPFTGPDGKLTYDAKLREEAMKGPNGELVYPEMARNTILFGGTDPGRFCPTYMIFCESFIPHDCQPVQDQKFDRRDVYLITQNALADGTYLDYLRAQYNRSKQIDPPFFREFLKYVLGIPLGEKSGIVRAISDASFVLLDKPFTKLGANIEARRRKEGVYPPNEIYIPSPEDSQNCFSEYMKDAQQRQATGQLRPGEYVNIDNSTVPPRVSVSGQVAVMMINGLLCKVIFDQNPTNEFYIEESFPLDWMYPYETPFGIIMKINRNPIPSLPESVFKQDHEFWSKYSERLIGDWITYDTSVKEIAAWAEKVYLQNNYGGFTGDRKFIRDDTAQKAFSKLRSSIAGVYAFRLGTQCDPLYRPKNTEEYNQLVREADFAFKQSFAFCPYSPEAVFRYVNLLLALNRVDDALIIAQTCQKFDPFNEQVTGLINQLKEFQKRNGQQADARTQFQQMEAEARTNPANTRNLLTLGSFYMQVQQSNRAVEMFNQALASTNISYSEVATLAQFYSQTFNFPKLEESLEKLTVLAPDQPESRYDLAALEAFLGKTNESLAALKPALELSARRLKTNPGASNLLIQAHSDPRFSAIRTMPEFQKLVPAN